MTAEKTAEKKAKRKPAASWAGWVTLAFAVVILIPSGYGFAAKFFEFAVTFREDPSGAFAITPILNYLLASIGFMLLLIWATLNGMFRDIEQPKFDLLRREAQLDRPLGTDAPEPSPHSPRLFAD